MGPWKKHKFDKSTGVEPLALMKGDLDEINNVVCFATEKIWGHIEYRK